MRSNKYDTVPTTDHEQPYIRDFAFYKSRFTTKHKDIKNKLREFGVIVDKFADSQS